LTSTSLHVPLLFSRYSHRRYLPSFPTRRSSDLRPWLLQLFRVVFDVFLTCLGQNKRALAPRTLLGTNEPLIFELLEAGKKYVKRSEEHTSELQSLTNLVCRLLLGKNNTNKHSTP